MLREREEETKRVEDAARRAAKKAQKPPKAERQAGKTRRPAAAAAPPAADSAAVRAPDAKEAAKARFLEEFQRLVKEGLPQTEAAARALQNIQNNGAPAVAGA